MPITAKQALEAVEDSKGFVTTIADRLGCTRSNVYALMKKFDTVNQAVIDERERMKDKAEEKLFNNIEDGKETSLIFYLKTQAKDRGYVEKQEIDHSTGGEPLGKALESAIGKIYGG